MRANADLTGRQFGKLTVVKLARRVPELAWECRCECVPGRNTFGVVVNHRDLLSGKTTHCHSPACGREGDRPTTRGTAMASYEGVRTADIRERKAFQEESGQSIRRNLRTSYVSYVAGCVGVAPMPFDEWLETVGLRLYVERENEYQR